MSNKLHKINYLSICLLEAMGNTAPTEQQIGRLEKLLGRLISRCELKPTVPTIRRGVASISSKRYRSLRA